MVKKKAYLRLEGEHGERHLGCPSPRFGLGLTQSLQRHLIDTTDSCFDQGTCSSGEGFSLAASGGVSPVWALQAMGARFCVGLFRWLLETPLDKAISLFGLSSGSSA